MRPPLSLLLGLTAALTVLALPPSPSARAAAPTASSIASSPITIYDAKWCSACRALEHGLTERKISFDTVDVDANPGAFARAREAASATSAIPLTSIVRTGGTVWVVGADVDAVERAHRGD